MKSRNSGAVRSMLLPGFLAAGWLVAGWRLLPHWCDNTSFTLSLISGAIATGVAIGFSCGWRWPMRRNGLRWILALVLLTVVATAPLLVPKLVVWRLGKVSSHKLSHSSFIWWQMRLLVPLLVPPAIVSGFLWSSLGRCNDSSHWRTTLLLASGLLAGVLVGYNLLAHYGIMIQLQVTLLLTLLFAGWQGVAARRWHRWQQVVLALLLVTAMAGYSLCWRGGESPLASHSIGAWLGTRGALTTLPGSLERHRDGRGYAVTLRGFEAEGYIRCRDGMAVRAFPGDRPAAALAVHLPLLLHAGAERLALLGSYDGVEVAAAAAHPLHLVEELGCDELQSEMVSMTLQWLEGGAAARDDSRIIPLRGSVPRLLRHRAERYDVIVIQGGAAWRRDETEWFKSALLRRCRQALAPDGIVCLAFEARTLPEVGVRGLISTFSAHFPEVQLWSPQLGHYLLLGARERFSFDAAQLLTQLEQREVMRSLALVGVTALPDMLAAIVLQPAGVERYLAAGSKQVGGGRLARLAMMGRLDPELSRSAVAGVEQFRTLELKSLKAGNLPQELFDRLVQRSVRQMAARAAVMALHTARDVREQQAAAEQARAAARLNPNDAFLNRLLLGIEQEASYALARRDYRSAERHFANVVEVLPERTSALYGLGLAKRGLGRNDEAYAHLFRAVAISPEEIDCRNALAEVAFRLGRETEALQHYQRALKQAPESADALIGLALCLVRSKPPIKNTGAGIEAAERAAALTGYRDRHIVATLADLYLECDRVVEGVSLKRRMRLIEER